MKLASTNYYQTLNVSPNATADDIKKAYRKLALIYHPDVAGDDIDALEMFRKIKIAYDVLSNTKTRQAYHYKHFYNEYKAQPIITTDYMALKADELANFTAVLDPYRLDIEGLFEQIYQILSAQNLKFIVKEQNETLKKSIILNFLKTAELLPYQKVLILQDTLKEVAGKNEELVAQIDQFIILQRRLHYWNKYKFALALLITITLCFTMFFLG